MSPLGGEVWAPAGSATITSSLLCLKITLYKTNSPSYHHLWQPSCLPYCWPCRHRNCHWFLSGRCAGQRVMWHTIEVGSPGQRPPSAAPHGAFLSFPPPPPPTYTPTPSSLSSPLNNTFIQNTQHFAFSPDFVVTAEHLLIFLNAKSSCERKMEQMDLDV